jgi:hypothetical protein
VLLIGGHVRPAHSAERLGTGTGAMAWVTSAGFTGNKTDRIAPFDWLSAARQHGIPWRRAQALYEQVGMNQINAALMSSENPTEILRELREFVEQLPTNLQRPEGRRTRLEWIDARIAELEEERRFNATIAELADDHAPSVPE